MGYTQWVLVQDADLAFAFVPYARYSSFHAGATPLPQVRPGEVRLVEIVLYLENRVATKLHSLHYRRFPVLANGIRDPEAINREMSLFVSLPFSDPQTGTESARGRFVQRQLNTEFRWTPTASELQSIAKAVNRRAKRPLMGRSPIQLVE